MAGSYYVFLQRMDDPTKPEFRAAGPMTKNKAEQYARISAQKGKRARTIARNPDAATFKAPTFFYEPGTGNKVSFSEYRRNGLRRAPKDPKKDKRRTPAKTSERVHGSRTNRPGSAASAKSGQSIKLSDKMEKQIAQQVREHNAGVARKAQKTTSGAAKSVVRRGMGAFSKSHHPTMTRGGWGMARLQHFFYLLRNGVPKNKRYTQDNDLLPPEHDKSTRVKKNSPSPAPPESASPGPLAVFEPAPDPPPEATIRTVSLDE